MSKKLTFDEIQNFQKKNRLQNTFPVYALLENIRSLYNVGSMFRTADAAGIDSIYLTGYTGFPPRKEIDKTALGSTETVKWKHYADPLSCVEKLKKEGCLLVACEHTEDAVDYREIIYKAPVCLMFGNEVDGLSQELCDAADLSVLIPMYGEKLSLNVSVAFGVAVYHAVHNILTQVSS